MPRVDALVTPAVLRWARERSRYSPDEAAKKIGRPVDEILAWEDGTLAPTIAQARRASEVYKRPLAVFYLPEPPREFDTLRDFRSLPDTQRNDYSPALALLIRVAQYQQEWTREHLEEEGIEKLPFIGAATLRDPPSRVALDILRVLELDPETQMHSQGRDGALRLWIHHVERAGVFVLRQSTVALEEARGFTLSDEIAPFIFVNSKDAKAGQLFTLVHELAHLWLNMSGISGSEPYRAGLADDYAKVEVFCNRVAAEVLLEESAFHQFWQRLPDEMELTKRIEQTSRSFKVSEEAVARRIMDSGIISEAQYLELRTDYQEQWQDYIEDERNRLKKAEGGPSHYVTKVSQNGRALTRTVIGALWSGAISSRDASELLNSKVNHLPRLAEVAGLSVSSTGRGAE